jgi:hypothetical protein
MKKTIFTIMMFAIAGVCFAQTAEQSANAPATDGATVETTQPAAAVAAPQPEPTTSAAPAAAPIEVKAAEAETGKPEPAKDKAKTDSKKTKK